jgi:hypothetical protein
LVGFAAAKLKAAIVAAAAVLAVAAAVEAVAAAVDAAVDAVASDVFALFKAVFCVFNTVSVLVTAVLPLLANAAKDDAAVKPAPAPALTVFAEAKAEVRALEVTAAVDC